MGNEAGKVSWGQNEESMTLGPSKEKEEEGNSVVHRM